MLQCLGIFRFVVLLHSCTVIEFSGLIKFYDTLPNLLSDVSMLARIARPLMLLMESKRGEQILRVHWENFLTTVILCYNFSHAWVLVMMSIHYFLFSKYVAGCDALACAVCLLHYTAIVCLWKMNDFTHCVPYIICVFCCSSSHWLLVALPCVEEILSGFGWFQLFHFMVQHGNSKLFNLNSVILEPYI